MTSPYSAPLSDLMDDFAMNAMAQLIHIYAPENTNNKEETVQWCANLASISYVMAASMIDTRTALHAGIVEDFRNKRPDEA
jgi:hypothetical protein